MTDPFAEWEVEEVARRRAEAEREDADPSIREKRRVRHEAELARNVRVSLEFDAEKARMILAGEWVEEDEE
jgi:hypothetical protein